VGGLSQFATSLPSRGSGDRTQPTAQPWVNVKRVQEPQPGRWNASVAPAGALGKLPAVPMARAMGWVLSAPFGAQLQWLNAIPSAQPGDCDHLPAAAVGLGVAIRRGGSDASLLAAGDHGSQAAQTVDHALAVRGDSVKHSLRSLMKWACVVTGLAVAIAGRVVGFNGNPLPGVIIIGVGLGTAIIGFARFSRP
jgi:hypothetical protein